jgi:ubiquitin C-terminal hydrolase
MYELDDTSKYLTDDKLKQTSNLRECLQIFSTLEKLGGDDRWYCSKCKEFRDAEKKLDLFKLPDILIIQLKRFQANGTKLNTLVDYPVRGLDLSEFVPGQENVVYDLYAISVGFLYNC